MCRVTIGHLRVTIGHIRVTIGHLRVTIGYFFISKHKANTTELHLKVRQTCFAVYSSNSSNSLLKSDWVTGILVCLVGMCS